MEPHHASGRRAELELTQVKLEGSLDAFSLPDVLALLAMTKKSGVLQLTRDNGPRGAIGVRQGLVVSATSDEGRQALLRRVVAAGMVDTDELERAVGAVLAGEHPTVSTALVAAGALEASQLRPLARQQVADAVFELLRWPEGGFAFSSELPAEDPAEVEVPVQDLVAEGQHRLEGWPALTERVPAPSTVLALSPVPETDPVCSRQEWGLLTLVDGHRSVAELVSLSGQGEWDVVSVLASLVERGLLAPLADPGALLRRHELLSRLETSVAAPGVTPAPAVAPAPTVAPAPAAGQGVPLLTVGQVSGTPEDSIPAYAPSAGSLEAELAGLTAGRRVSPGGAPPAYPTVAQVTDGALAVQPVVVVAELEGEQDASVNRALLLRLIAGVRAL